MATSLPTLILTGASGFVGRNFLEIYRDRFRIYAMARRAQKKSGVANHPNIRWIQLDLGNQQAVARAIEQIEREGGADFVVHLAAFYDFEYHDKPAYQSTNIDGTRYLLEEVEKLGIRRFIFASSVAACNFPPPGECIDEETPPDADYAYAISKKAGEQMMKEYSTSFPCTVVRLAAVFSDWCEYAVLYVFLSTWLSKTWNARVIGGKGTSAVPYIHVRDICRLFNRILERSEELPQFGIYVGSPDGATSQRELFGWATRSHLGIEKRPIYMPKFLALPGVFALDLLGRLIGRRPFERPWMLKYLDLQLRIDASRTRREVGWSPKPRLHIQRRILFLLEKMKCDPQEWTLRNERAMKRPPVRPMLIIHDAMTEAREAIVDAISAYLQSPGRQDRFFHYGQMDSEELRWYLTVIYDLLLASVRTRDRTLLLSYIEVLSRRRQEQGFPASEVCDALLAISEVTVRELLQKPEIHAYQNEARDSVALSIALAIDGVQDTYEGREDSGGAADELEEDLEGIVAKLNAFYRSGE